MANGSLKRSRIRGGINKYDSVLAGNTAYAGLLDVSGGVLSADSTYYYRTFTSSGSLVVSGGTLSADILVIAGGGGTGGGSPRNGGGGAGGVVYQTGYGLASGTYTVAVGAGGAGTGANQNGSSGVTSSLNGVSATGGGYGGGYEVSAGANGGTGGSGGGAGCVYLGSAQTGGSNVAGQGFSGGNSIAESTGGWIAGGGGGGAGGAGGAVSGTSTASTTVTPGNGGAGTNAYAAWLTATGYGVSGYVAGGGAGGGINSGGSNIYGTATAGGGSNAAATANTGGGAGGGGYAGGSGIVIVRYLKTAVQATQTDFEVIGTIELSAAQPVVQFTGLPSEYSHLQLRIETKSTAAVVEDNLLMRFNGDSGNNYVHHNLYGTGAATNSNWTGGAQSYLQPGSTMGTSTASANYGVHIIDILDAFSTAKNKVTKTSSGFVDAAISRVYLSSGLWMSTAAISTITFATSSNVASGSRFTLIGLRG